MRPVLLENVISEKELFFMYNKITTARMWEISGLSSEIEYPSNKQFNQAPVLRVMTPEEGVIYYPFYFYGQSIVYKISDMLKEKHIGINTNISRMWYNVTYDSSDSNWLHTDSSKKKTLHTIVMFLTPVWQENWRGSFYVDGQEFKFKPGSAVIFDSQEYHTGESQKNSGNWLRLTSNMVLE